MAGAGSVWVLQWEVHGFREMLNLYFNLGGALTPQELRTHQPVSTLQHLSQTETA